MPISTLSGQFETTAVAGTKVQAFVPYALPPKPALDLDAKLRRSLDEAALALGALQGAARALPAAEVLIYSYVRREAVLSSQIEGTRSTLAQLMAFEAEGTLPGVPLEDLRETSRAVDSMQHGLERLAEGFPLSVRLLKEMHLRLMGPGPEGSLAAAGELRRSQNWIGGKSPDKAAHVPPPPHRVQECLADLERYWHRDEPLGLLVKVALSHAQFESIHPFLDGNGRLGRQWVTLMLMHDGVLDGPWLWLSLGLKRNRQQYYRLLNGTRRRDGWAPWVAFFAESVKEAAQDSLNCALQLKQAAAQDLGRIVDHGRRQTACVLLHEAFCKRPVLSVKQACEATGLVPNAVANGLELLASLRLVKEMTGRKRDRVFAYASVLKILNPATEEAAD